MGRNWWVPVSLAILVVLVGGCGGGGAKRSIPGNWTFTEQVLGQNASCSMLLKPDKTMTLYARLEYDKQPGALEVRGKWEADEQNQILTLTKTEAYWNNVLTDIPAVLGTESGKYRWQDGSLVWTRDVQGRRVTTTLNYTGEP